VLVVLASPASAHTVLQSVTPAEGAVVADPGEVQLVFSGELREELVTVVVSGPDGADVADGPPSSSGGSVVQPLRRPLAGGTWTVAYRVVADDGHPLTGTSTFVVEAQVEAAPGADTQPMEAAPGAGSPPTEAGPPPPDQEVASEPAAAPPAPTSGVGGAPVLLLVLLAAVVVAAGLLAARLRGAGRAPGRLPST
jgi:copper resistance protein C